ncbi:choice-of-anchor Q domain-containing protein [Massilia sp. IC2-476]|uniref:choice-of-anchor Q domain-containing protein n=1 Tax=Massilia sp. IC2-476 TaxID=2887199 RepID=UPI001D1286BC|nr:choice-of-anchor Q domain-containing protein [Massilia sp. IC2-476]MCC2972597.1 right-handed parallel beta-helix repeat-containing protein [Massilia sp. IC2-476]
MNKTFAFASHIRHHAVLCGTAAALLGAFGVSAAATAATAPTFAAATTAQQNQINQLYVQLLGRPADAGGLAYWSGLLDRGVSLDYIAAQLKASEEYAKRNTNSGPTAGGGLPAIPATTYNYYVSPTGSDSANGSKATPFKTLARAAQVANKPSTTVWVAPGTYAGGFKTTGNGTASGRIYWVSTTKWGAKIVPPANSTNKTAWDNRGNYVSIIGFEVDGSKIGSGTKWTLGIYTGGSYNVIQGNHVHHTATTIPCNSAGGSAIGVDSYYKGVKGDVIGNVVHDIGPAGCTYVQGIYHSTSGTIMNNLVYRVGSAAIHLWHDATDLKIINNTVTSSVFGIIVGGGDYYFTSAGANNVHVHNNIVYDNKYGISEQGKTGTGNTYKNNLVFQNPTYNFQLRNGLTHTNTISSNPMFVGYSRTAATPNYELSASSPAIGRAISTYAPSTDIDGVARGASADLGAYQH